MTDIATKPVVAPAPPTIEVCHAWEDHGAPAPAVALCGAPMPNEPECCDNGARPCGRPKCPLCDLAWDEIERHAAGRNGTAAS